MWVWMWEGGVGFEGLLREGLRDGLWGEGLLEEREMEKGFFVDAGGLVEEAEGMAVVCVGVRVGVREEVGFM